MRVATTAYRANERRFGVCVGAQKVFAEAIAIEFDTVAWQKRFLRDWPPGSDAHASYFERIAHGPACRLDDAVRAEA